MAGGWARDGAVNEQIDALINDELARMKAKRQPVGPPRTVSAVCYTGNMAPAFAAAVWAGAEPLCTPKLNFLPNLLL